MNTAHIIALLDRSGSIQLIADDAIGGFNRFLEDQKALGGSTITLVLFDHVSSTVYSRLPIACAPALTITSATQNADSPGAAEPEKVICIIFTDGLENAPDALIGLLAGRNFGKVVVRVAETAA